MTLFRSFKILGAALAGVVALGSPAALADDSARRSVKDYGPPQFSWTGFYAGVNVGWASSDLSSSSAFTCPTGACPYGVPANLQAFGVANSGSIDGSGFTGGTQAGYNWQSGSAVLGIELDFNAFDIGGSRGAVGPVPIGGGGASFIVNRAVNTDWLFTLRGRLGWTVTPTLLLYATGGLAVTEVTLSNAFADTNALTTAGASSVRDTRTGWTVGGGFEWALNRNWTFKTEYLFLDFGSLSTVAAVRLTGVANPNLFATTADIDAHIVRAGINYKF